MIPIERFCEICKKQISRTRLRILPETRHCVKCSIVERVTETQVSMRIPETDQEELIHRIIPPRSVK